MRRIIEKIKRMLFWGWKLRDSYDFDAHTIYEILYLKLDRVYNVMLNNSHLMWNDSPDTPGMRRLREARDLALRFSQDFEEYDHRAFDETRKLFGPSNMQFTDNGVTSDWGEDAHRYLNIRRKHWNKVKSEQHKRLFYLIEKYTCHWWD